LGGYLSDRLGRVPVIITACLIAAPAIFLLNVARFGFAIVILLLALGMSSSVRSPVLEAYILGRTGMSHRSTILGIYYFGNMEGGGLMIPVIGHLIDRYGFSTSYLVAAVTIRHSVT